MRGSGSEGPEGRRMDDIYNCIASSITLFLLSLLSSYISPVFS